MKKVFIRVNKSVSVDDAVAHLESLGYKNIWSCGFTPEGMADSLCGEEGGEIGWTANPTYFQEIGFQEIFLPTTKHKHYDLIVKWAADPLQGTWVKIDGKWVEISVLSLVNRAIGEHLELFVGHKPPSLKITIGDVEIDAPEIGFPERGATVFIAAPDRRNLYIEEVWEDFAHLRQHKWRGLVHLNKEAAIAHAKALIKVSGGGVC